MPLERSAGWDCLDGLQRHFLTQSVSSHSGSITFDGPYEKVIDAKKVDGNFKLKVGTEARQASRRPAPPGHVMKHLFANYSRAIERVPCTIYEWFERPREGRARRPPHHASESRVGSAVG